MATIDFQSVYTLLDIAKTHQNKDLLPIAELLHRKNGILRFTGWEQANQFTSHLFSKEVYLPSGNERAVGEGTASEKPQVDQGNESLFYMESKSEIDILMQTIMGSGFAAWRYKMDILHSEGLGQSIANKIFYGTGAPGKLRGLQVRYNSLSATTNVKSAGGAVSVANTSMWVIQPGFGGFNMLYGASGAPGQPDEYSTGVIKMQDMGIELVVTDTTYNKSLHKFVTLFGLMMGLCVYDDRAVQRLCNINTTTGAGEVDPDQLWWLIESLPNPEGPKYIFGNRIAIYQLKKNLQNKALYTTGPDQYGQVRDFFMGVPIVLTEAITNTEAVVS
jgi:hypothetical protein